MINYFRSNRGLTLLELMVVVAIVGILAAVAVPTYMRHVRRSKTAEAKEFLMDIYQAEMTYEADRMRSGGRFIACGPILVGGVPAGGANNVQVPLPAAWQTLGVSPGVIAMRYDFFVAVDGGAAPPNPCGAPLPPVGNPWFVAIANGDLDGDGAVSTFLITSTNRRIIPCNELE